MPRSITESLTALENARNDIVDALNSKIEGGGLEKTLKISEVAEKINSIEVGGGSEDIPITVKKITDKNGIEYELGETDVHSFPEPYTDLTIEFDNPTQIEHFLLFALKGPHSGSIFSTSLNDVYNWQNNQITITGFIGGTTKNYYNYFLLLLISPDDYLDFKIKYLGSFKLK